MSDQENKLFEVSAIFDRICLTLDAQNPEEAVRLSQLTQFRADLNALIDLETEARKAADAAEQAAREAADSTLQTALDQEIVDRTAADAALKAELESKISNDINALVSGAPGTLDTLNEIAQALQNNPDVVQTLLDAIAAEEVRAKAAEAALQAAIDQEVADRVAAVDDVQAAVDAEKVAREQADADAALFNLDARTTLENELSLAIAREGEVRFATDQAIANDLAVEINRAKDAESALRTDLDQEVADRVAAVASVQAAVDAEKVARENADVELDSKLTAEVTARIEAVADLNTKLLDETTARSSADTALQASITAEIERAQLAEGELSDKIELVSDDLASETARALEAEQQLRDDKLDRVNGIGQGLHRFDRLHIVGTQDAHSVYLTFGKWRISAHHNGARLCFEYNQSSNDVPDWQTAVPFITGAKDAVAPIDP